MVIEDVVGKLVLITADVVIGVIAFKLAQRTLRLARRGCTTRGTIVGQTSGSDEGWLPVARFTADAPTPDAARIIVTFTSMVPDSDLQNGREVTVLYDPVDPTRATLDLRTEAKAAIALVLAAVGCASCSRSS